MDHKTLPPGVNQLPPGEHAIAAATSTGPNKVTVSNPVMLGQQCQVQHPTTHPSGAEPTSAPGLLAGTVFTTPSGPLLALQVRHADGTNLSALMSAEEAVDWNDTWQSLLEKVKLLAVEPEGRG